MRRIKGLEVGDVVVVHWADACGKGGWMRLETVDGTLTEILTVGVVLINTKLALTVGQSLDEGEAVDNWITVPWVGISDVEVLAT